MKNNPALRKRINGTVTWAIIYSFIMYLSHRREPLTAGLITYCLIFGVAFAALYKFLLEPALNRWNDRMMKKRYGNRDNGAK